MSHDAPTVVSVTPVIGLEVHVELATRTKMFSRALSPAGIGAAAHPEPNTLIDPTVLGLPGSLPVMNKAAVEMAARVGLALRCAVAPESKWDRKGYYYPDLPKNYQISQYDQPLCFDGAVDLPASDDKGFPDLTKPPTRIGIIRAHLEEDAGKLLHEAPGGRAIEGSIVDFNRAGTPLLEIVTAPDFTSADQVVLFARWLRTLCRALGVTRGVMQEGHMRFEPNINVHLTLSDGHVVKTPIIEVKNLNSFKALREAIVHELAEQPGRWLADRRVQGRGSKVTRGWDEARGATFVQRDKEDAHDYRYFPDPDLAPVTMSPGQVERLRASLPELPLDRLRRYTTEAGLGVREAAALLDEPATTTLYDATTDSLVGLSVERARAGKLAANLILGPLAALANERGLAPHELGLSPARAAGVCKLREDGGVGNQGLADVVRALAAMGPDAPGDGLAQAQAAARSLGVLIVRDDDAARRCVEQAIANHPKAADDVRAGKLAAAGRLVGEAMKLAGAAGDAKVMRELILKLLGQA